MLAAICSIHSPPPLVKTICGMRAPACSRLSCLSTRPGVGEAEFLEGAVGEHAAPAVEHHHRLSTGFDLHVQVQRHRIGVDRQDAVHQVRSAVHHRLDETVVVRASAFDHVAGQRPRAAGEADQRHAAVQRLADRGHCVEHVAQLVHVGHGELHHIGFLAHRMREAWTFAESEAQAQAHRVGHGEDVAEQDGRIERVAVQRLQRHVGGVLRVRRQAHEAAGSSRASRGTRRGSGRPGASATRGCVRWAGAGRRAGSCRSGVARTSLDYHAHNLRHFRGDSHARWLRPADHRQHAAHPRQPAVRRHARGLDQERARQPRRLDQGPHRAVDDRGGRGLRRAQARRHHHRADLGQHRRGPGDGRRSQGLQAGAGDARQHERRAPPPDAGPMARVSN